MKRPRQYIAIDLKSFYASVECVERGLDPLDANLVVADLTRTNKTICLAVSPSLKKFGTGGRPRLFEVEQKIRWQNTVRHSKIRNYRNAGKSISGRELDNNPLLDIDYIVAPPRMALYLDYSTRIFSIYLRHVAPEDIHVYSIDEVFIDATAYLPTLGISAHEMTLMMIREVLAETGITATAGIGSNLYLAKVAMDIVAKRMPADKDGVRIAELDEMSYRHNLWSHQPLTDFWRVGRGTARKLADYGLLTMGDVARCSLNHESTLYRLFGVNAELLIDHAWGYEPVTIADIKAYRPATHSLSSGQVLTEPYTADRARIVVLEMAESIVLDLIRKRLSTSLMTLTIGYDTQSLVRPEIRDAYSGPIHIDHYGRAVPQHTHGTTNLHTPTQSSTRITSAIAELFDSIVNPILLIRRITIATTTHSLDNEKSKNTPRQLTLFDDFDPQSDDEIKNRQQSQREIRLHSTMNEIKQRFGKNAILKGLSFAEGATARERNRQIGGHKA